MEKMNQVSVTEFMSKSKEEMYDMAVEMVEKYNNLIDRKTVYTNALNKEIAEKAAKIDLLEKEIEGRKEGYAALKELMDTKYIPIDENDNVCKAYEKKVAELEKDLKKWQDLGNMSSDIICNQYDVCEDFKKKIAELEKQNEYLTKELEQTYKDKETDLKNHNRRDMNLVDELAGKNDKIKSLVEEIEYYKGQERIRTDQLRATERKVDELYKQIEGLTNSCRSKNTEIARLAKEHADIRHELAKRTAELEFNGEDDHGRAGFKKYIEWLIEEEERVVPERFKTRLNEEITEIFEKEEEPEVKGNGRTSSGRYPWDTKIIRCEKPDNFRCVYGYNCPVEAMEKCKFAKEWKSDIPCGSDAIE